METNFKKLFIVLVSVLFISNIGAVCEKQNKAIEYIKGLACGVGAINCAYILIMGDIGESLHRIIYKKSNLDEEAEYLFAIPFFTYTIYQLSKDAASCFISKKEKTFQKSKIACTLRAAKGLGYSALALGSMAYINIIGYNHWQDYKEAKSDMKFFEQIFKENLTLGIAPFALAYAAYKAGSKASKNFKLANN